MLALSEYTFQYDIAATNEKKHGYSNITILENILAFGSVLVVTNFSSDFSEKEL